MVLLSLWIYILIGFALTVFGVFTWLCFVWTNRDTLNRQNIITGIQVAALHTFKIFLYCSLIFILIYIFFYIYGK
ncbi:hypothetical protein COT20_01000 [bacterium (Candidatus Gribaldobacteria) CG08_land_8_20_14_0_20_39_15]|uniref:Uncharacterized protein n=1 Tax=bacterium (Candidatus Gribaldobacteria) CG08_land_8_20_14_0_20_39_15 TaxID=2014273 RepID=A0A2M6XV16_9BACT|nr:MAG: hypothetical protein COT20_01000 [bacterium (Candidatus Gribaldobacteria) CG08_land_8_20_14_0_20_39_15]